MYYMDVNKDISLKGVVGIQNMGNTCYCNSTLQLLRACSEWSLYCVTNDFNGILADESNQNKRILLAYQDILKTVWSAYKPAYVRPLGFISEVQKAVRGTVYEAFAFPMQHDSHEYLIYLLDHFHEALKTEIEYIPKSIGAEPNMRILAENGWNEYLSKNNSEIVRLFFGMMRKTILCTNCNNKTYQWEIFNSIKVPCDGVAFQDWIRHEVNECTDIEGYKCNNCNGHYLAKKYSHIWKLPKNLFITIHRFHYNGHKNMTNCPYNGSRVSFKEFFAVESDDPMSNVEYELQGESDHHGPHLGGHFTAQFKHPISGE